jgi:hypothetical protein
VSGLDCEVAVVGAGPYGLSAAAHLSAAQIDVRLFGEPMEFWQRHMPEGMILRSSWRGCRFSDVGDVLTPQAFERVRGEPLRPEVTLEDFVAYGRWFQRHAVPDVDQCRVVRVEAGQDRFRLLLDDGRLISARRVVIACGLGAFARRPAQFDAVGTELASHTSEHPNLTRFAGQRLVVVGAGQSAIESAALLHEVGADVEVVMRAPSVRWLRHGTRLHTWLHSAHNPVRAVLYSPTNIGPPGVNWVVETPQLFRRLPREFQSWVRGRSTRPAAAGWLRARTRHVRITTGRIVASAARSGKQLRITLDDGTQRDVDHALLATGYRIDVSQYTFLPPALVSSITLFNGYPQLSEGFESSVPGLHFLGAPAAHTFGPLMGFVGGTRHASKALTKCVLRTRSTLVGGKVESVDSSSVLSTVLSHQARTVSNSSPTAGTPR